MAEQTIGDVIDAVQEGQPIDERTLRLTLLAVWYHAQMACTSNYANKPLAVHERRAEENFERQFRMLKATPATWLGPGWTPGTPENAAGREASKKVLSAFERKKERAT